MRIVVSIQSKRGSSRGLIHYLAHSKIHPDQEPEHGRELFNRYADSLDVKSANNHLKIDTSKSRPSNDELHHLVFSFRAEDFAKLGTTEKERKRGAKQMVCAALERLEESLGCEKLAWTGAVHRNTENPHVHVGIQKQFFTKGLEKKILTKIPREAIPHYEHKPDGTKHLAPGLLIEAAGEKLEELVRDTALREKQQRNRKSVVATRNSVRKSNRNSQGLASSNEEKILAQVLLLNGDLKASTNRVDSLFAHGDKMRFVVFDAVSGKNRRVSLEDLTHRAEARALDEIRRKRISEPAKVESLKQRHIASEYELNAAAVRRIRTVLFKLTAQEEKRRQSLERKFRAVDRQAKAIRESCRKEGRKLPTPALTKDELDRLQEQSLVANDIRSFAYLERVRTELSAVGKIEPRDDRDVNRLFALRTVFSLRATLQKKHLVTSRECRYARPVELNGSRWSLVELEAPKSHPKTGKWLQERHHDFKKQILEKLDFEDRQSLARQKTEEKKAKLIDDVLSGRGTTPPIDFEKTLFDSQQLAEVESLAFRLKDSEVYERNWELQKHLIEAAPKECRIGQRISKAHTGVEAANVFADEKRKIIAGRALAREIVGRIQLDEARSNLTRFSKGKRFQKFEIVDTKSGTNEFVSLNDVEALRSGSFLDQAVEYLSESRAQRHTRRTVMKAVKEKEESLKAELKAAKDIFASATKAAADYKHVAFFGLKSVPVERPLFTAFEVATIERRISQSSDHREGRRLEKILDGVGENAPESLTKLLLGFESEPPQPERILEKEPTNARLTAEITLETEHRSTKSGLRSNSQDQRSGRNHLRHDPTVISR